MHKQKLLKDKKKRAETRKAAEALEEEKDVVMKEETISHREIVT